MKSEFGIYIEGDKNIGYIEKVEKLIYDPYNTKIKYVKVQVDKPEVFLGRVDDMTNLKKLLEDNKSLLLLNGIGGVGKTTLAKEYYTSMLTEYDSLVWIDYVCSLFSSFHTPKMTKYFQIAKFSKTPEEAFYDIVRVLENIEGNNLLVIDNIFDIEDFIKYENHLPQNWKTLITSRSNIDEYETLYLDSLDEESAKKLFYRYYHLQKDDEVLENILKRVAYHTLTIEMVAKASNKLAEPLSKIYQNLEELGINIRKVRQSFRVSVKKY